jgi:prepilin-type N-terminal cleavage/methylation domain-containing protein
MRDARIAPGRQAGVTLLEMVITLTIVSLLGLIVLQAFRLGGNAWDKGEQRVETAQRIRVLSGILAQRLASLQPAIAKPEGKPVLAFQGRPDRIFFYSAPDGEGLLPYSAMVRGQAYFVESGKGLVVQESYPLVEGDVSLDPRGAVTVLEPNVTQITFRYLSPPDDGETEPRWVDVWDPVKAASDAQAKIGQPGQLGGPGRLPLAVGLTMAVQDQKGTRKIALLLPIHVGQVL